MSRTTLVALALLFAVLVGVTFGALRLVREARSSMLTAFGEERRSQLEEVARIVYEDLDSIASDLRYVGRLVQTARPSEDRSREVSALLETSPEYVLVAAFDRAGARLLTVADPTSELRLASFEVQMREAAKAALASSDELQALPPIDEGDRSLRVFAMRLPKVGARAPGAVAVVVDTTQLFSKLRLVTADHQLHLVLLSPNGQPARVSDPHLASAINAGESPAYASLIGAMRRGDRGLYRIDQSDAERLGLGPVELVATFMPVRAGRGPAWSVALLTSTKELDVHERAIVGRLGAISLAMLLCLLGLGAWLVLSARRAAVLSERLRHSEQVAGLLARTEKILDNIPTCVMTLAADSRVTAVNHALRERGGLPGGSLAEALPAAPAQMARLLLALVATARNTSSVRSLFGENLTLFGSEGQYNVHAVPLDAPTDEARDLLVIEDVSRVGALESQLLRAEKLATVGELAAGMAHELGTPLGVVRGRAEYVLKKLGSGHPQSDGLSDIVEQIDQVTRTIRQLLDFSRVSPAAVRAVELQPIAEAVVGLLHFEAERRKLKVACHVEPELGPLWADPDQLEQVLVNLLKNAFDACAEGGQVVVRARRQPSLWQRAVLEVEDDGCGVAKSDLPRVFDPFFTTKKRGQGTGLGLAVTSQVVRNHGGEISIESEEGRGARVTILWPVADVEASRSHA